MGSDPAGPTPPAERRYLQFRGEEAWLAGLAAHSSSSWRSSVDAARQDVSSRWMTASRSQLRCVPSAQRRRRLAGARVPARFGRDRSDSNALVEGYGLVDQGYVLLTFDARGHGSSGGLVSVAGPREVSDVRAIYAWLANRPDVADARIGAWGISYGGGTILNSLVAGVPWAASSRSDLTDLYSGPCHRARRRERYRLAGSSRPQARSVTAAVQAAAFVGNAAAVRPRAAAGLSPKSVERPFSWHRALRLSLRDRTACSHTSVKGRNAHPATDTPRLPAADTDTSNAVGSTACRPHRSPLLRCRSLKARVERCANRGATGRP
jgi:hypothetical protein